MPVPSAAVGLPKPLCVSFLIVSQSVSVQFFSIFHCDLEQSMICPSVTHFLLSGGAAGNNSQRVGLLLTHLSITVLVTLRACFLTLGIKMLPVYIVV